MLTSKDQAEKDAFRFLRNGGVVKICAGCGSVQSIAEIQREHPGALSCCPERKMVQHRLFTAEMLEVKETT